ncbi:Hypothetical_protein [Hexamita inflata]|uniref:Hypothetical_protein n=1 Tax=Hexamita inflata TaxID=28002 RepID=A0AA86RCU9_9EUKA|nr:Hypothetical protein HINF_LOCUS63499 [Hexamita inflata]
MGVATSCTVPDGQNELYPLDPPSANTVTHNEFLQNEIAKQKKIIAKQRKQIQTLYNDAKQSIKNNIHLKAREYLTERITLQKELQELLKQLQLNIQHVSIFGSVSIIDDVDEEILELDELMLKISEELQKEKQSPFTRTNSSKVGLTL